MKIFALTVLAGLTLGAATSGLAAGVFPYKVQRETLDNGLKVLLVPMRPPRVSSPTGRSSAPAAATRSSRGSPASPTSSST